MVVIRVLIHFVTNRHMSRHQPSNRLNPENKQPSSNGGDRPANQPKQRDASTQMLEKEHQEGDKRTSNGAGDRSNNGSKSSSKDSRQSHSRKRIGLIVLGLVVLAGVGYGVWRWWSSQQSGEQTEQQQGPRAVPVALSEVDTATVENTSEFTGTLEAEQTVGVQPQQPGEVEQILVTEGQQVGAGAPLVQLGSTRERADVEAAQAQVEVAEAARASAAAEIESLRAARSEVLAEIDLQQEQIGRTQYLVREGALAREQLDIKQRDLRVAQSNLNTLERDINAAEAQLDEERATLRQRRANLRRIREDLQDTTVNAPFAGTISLIPIEEGDYVETGQTLTNIVDNQDLELNIGIPQERIPELRVGLSVRLESAQGEVLSTGEISFIAPQVNGESQLISTKASFSNANGMLRDGQFVRAVVIWDERPEQVVVPQTAVIYRNDRRFVYVPQQRDGQMVAVQQPVQLGIEQGTGVEINQGLEEGDRIVTSGIQKLSDGAPIRSMQQGGGAQQSGGNQ